MLRKRTFTQRLRALPVEKQIMAMMNVITILACFLPWYGINSPIISESWNAFNSIGLVAGYLLLTFSLLSLFIIVGPAIREEFDLGKKLPFSDTSQFLFLNGQSVFVTLIFIPVFSQYSFLYETSSSTRFGIYLALISTFIAFIFALSYRKKGSLTESREDEFFNIPRTHRELSPDEMPEDSIKDATIPKQEASVQESIFHE